MNSFEVQRVRRAAAFIRSWRFFGGCLAVLLSLSAAVGGGRVRNDRLTFSFSGHSRTVYYYAPSDPQALPVVVLLHGSGRDGTEMLDAWRSLASSEHFLLIAPNSLSSAIWDSQEDPPAFLHAAVDQVGAMHAIDPRRIYLFGHSGGAVYALALALLDSDYYAATAVHAGALPQNGEHLFRYAKRRMPIAMWVGDMDPLFPPERVAATEAALTSHGFDVRLHVLPKHTHNYSEVSEVVDTQAWAFFRDLRQDQP